MTGDLTQTDLPKGQKSGLGAAVKILAGIEDIGIHYFSERDVVRHRLVQKIIQAYEKYDRERQRPRTGGVLFLQVGKACLQQQAAVRWK